MTAPLVDVLARVQAEHELRWSDDGGWADCSCGHRLPQSLAPDDLDAAHRAHVAAEQVRALGEWLTSDQTGMAVQTSLYGPSALVSRGTAKVLAAVADYGLGGA